MFKFPSCSEYLRKASRNTDWKGRSTIWLEMIQLSRKKKKVSQNQEKHFFLKLSKDFLYAQQVYSDTVFSWAFPHTHSLLRCLLVRSVLNTLWNYPLVNKVAGPNIELKTECNRKQAITTWQSLPKLGEKKKKTTAPPPIISLVHLRVKISFLTHDAFIF